MGVEQYIGELLYRYNCVVVPEFGAFLTQMKSAVIHRPTHTFYPPTKVISFNEQLASNDGLLVSYMANAERISYEEMLGKTLDTVVEWKRTLRKRERLALENIGELWLNREGKILFQPVKKVNYLTSSFGLSPVVSGPVTREVLKEEVAVLKEKVPFVIAEGDKAPISLRPYLKYAAIVLLAVSTAVSGYRIAEDTEARQDWVQQQAQEMVSRNIQEATFFNTRPVELSPLRVEMEVANKVEEVKTDIVEKQGPMHHIIAGAFRYKENAEKKIRRLKRKGYDSQYLGTNPYGLHHVTFGSFDNAEEALRFLDRVKRTESRDAWLLSKK